MKEIIMSIRVFSLVVAMLAVAMTGNAQCNNNRINVGVGALYERGLDATLAFEHETKHHNAWEYFANGYVKWSDDPMVGHVTNKSFWKDYRTWSLGVAYKPCVTRNMNFDKNNYGSLRMGASLGSDTHEFMGIITVGYEHNFVLRHGWRLYCGAKSDVCINGKDLFRTGVVIGIKLPVNNN